MLNVHYVEEMIFIVENNKTTDVMHYNNLLMFQINSVMQNINLGGSGFEQVQNLRACLKPLYQNELNERICLIDEDYNKNAVKLEHTINNASLLTERNLNRLRLVRLRKDYSRVVVAEIISILDKYNVLEWKEREGLNTGLI